MPRLSVDTANCTRCGLCVQICPLRIIQLAEGKLPDYVPDGKERCIICGHCEAVCPPAALVLDDPRLESPAASARPDDDPILARLRMRRSIRRFQDEPVDRELIARLLDIARYAPSGSNLQPIQWLVIHDTGEVRRLTRIIIDWMHSVRGNDSAVVRHFNFDGMIRSWEKGHDPLCRNAPHLIIAHSREDALTAPVDALIALTHLDIAAPTFGLGTCWAGFFQFAVSQWAPLREAMALPPGHRCNYALMVGYPAIHYQRPPRRNRQSITWR